MELAQLVERLVRRQADASFFEAQLQSPNIRQCHDTREKVASDLAVSPVSDGPCSNVAWVLALSETILDLPSLEVSLDDVSCCPVCVVGDDDVLPE